MLILCVWVFCLHACLCIHVHHHTWPCSSVMREPHYVDQASFPFMTILRFNLSEQGSLECGTTLASRSVNPNSSN